MPHSQRIALMVTCMVDQVMPEIGVATVHLLRRAGYTVEFPTEQTCCGQPFFNSGFREKAARLARRTIAMFEPYDAVVIPGGSCTAMMRQEYPHLLESDPVWAERAKHLGAKTFELSEFLVQQAHWLPATNPKAPSITYHDSCHMNRLLGLGADSRTLLTAAGCTILEMQESDRCCGFGGVFSIRMPEISNAMTKQKIKFATESGADIIVSADPGCLMQMRGLLAGQPIRAEHLAIVLDEVTS